MNNKILDKTNNLISANLTPKQIRTTADIYQKIKNKKRI
jgi:hypothetical protein